MNKALAILLVSVLAFGCVSQQTPSPTPQTANPASQFCEARGGTLKIVTAADGSQAGYCTLATGEECEEWAYYRGECPVASPVPSPECYGHQVGESWKEDCNICSCTKAGTACTLVACPSPTPSPLPTPSPTPITQASDDFSRLKDYVQHYLRIYFNNPGFEMKMDYYEYFARWTGDYKPPLTPDAYSIELRKKNDYLQSYGKSSAANGVVYTWETRGSYEDVHWLEFKCGEFQYWSETPMLNTTRFGDFVNASTYACAEYLAAG